MDDFQLAAMMLTAAVGRPTADNRRLTTPLQSVGGRAVEGAHNPVYLGTKAKIQEVSLGVNPPTHQLPGETTVE